jgi:Kef-type K+ transport system membrane component KefB
MALVGRYLARKVSQPSVLGELIMGILIGNVGYYFGSDLITIVREGANIFEILSLNLCGESLENAACEVIRGPKAHQITSILHAKHGYDYLQVAHIVDIFSRYGVIFLLFMIGLETDFKQIRKVGSTSVRVAIIGVVVPFILGFWAVRIVNPSLSFHTDLFVAAALGATSVGISARVLKDLKQSQTETAHVILGASVIDDILGLVIMAIVSGIIVNGEASFWYIASIIFSALGFLACVFYLSPYFLRLTISLVKKLDLVEAKMFISLLFVMILSWLSSMIGLSTIIGAFAAGIVLHEGYFVHWGDVEDHQFTIKDLISPLEVILVPIFFILMGMQVKLEIFLNPKILTMTVGLLLAAVLGKLVSGLGAKGKQNRLAIGIGMVPRGEVGLVFASIGMSLHVVDEAMFSAIVLMVLMSTLIAPFGLKHVLTITK